MNETLKAEISTAKIYLGTVENVSTMVDVYKHLNALKSSFKYLIHLFKIDLPLPISTASNERLFSALKRVKCFIRNRTGDERLSILLLMATEQNFVKKT